MRKLLLGSLTFLMSASMAHAGPISFLFNSPTGNRGFTETYTTGTPPLFVTAAGFDGKGTGKPTAVELWGKTAGSGEQGLGLVNDPSGDHEITYGSFIQLDVQGLFGKVSTMSAKFAFDSTTGTEKYAVYGSNTAGVLGTLLTSGDDQSMHSLPDFTIYRYYDFGSYTKKGNVLLSEISAYQTVPEPASMALVGAGLLGLGYFRRRAGRV